MRGGGGFSRGGFGGGGFSRGGYGGGFNRGGYAGGGFERGGMAGAGINRGSFQQGGMARAEGTGAFPRSAYGGGGFNSIAGARPGTASNFSQFTGHNPSQLASDGGLGGISGRQNQVSGERAGNFDRTNIGNTVNPTIGNTYNRNFVSTGYHPNYGGYGNRYGAYGHPYGYHPYGAYGYHGCYGGMWGYPGCWAGAMTASMWTCMGVSTLTSFLGLAALSGSNKKAATNNITYEGDNVYVNGQPAQQYYQQAQQLAATAGASYNASQQYGSTGMPLNQQLAYNPEGNGQIPTAGTSASGAAEQWEPLGVYSLVEPGQEQSTMLFQLAINKGGIIRGNYLNQITNERAQIHGALDKSTQQMSWSIGDNPDTVFGTTLSELMKEQGKVVVQFGPDKTKQMSLVRQQPPAEETQTQPQSS
jgi:hypothetical protein